MVGRRLSPEVAGVGRRWSMEADGAGRRSLLERQPEVVVVPDVFSGDRRKFEKWRKHDGDGGDGSGRPGKFYGDRPK